MRRLDRRNPAAARTGGLQDSIRAAASQEYLEPRKSREDSCPHGARENGAFRHRRLRGTRSCANTEIFVRAWDGSVRRRVGEGLSPQPTRVGVLLCAAALLSACRDALCHERRKTRDAGSSPCYTDRAFREARTVAADAERQ